MTDRLLIDEVYEALMVAAANADELRRPLTAKAADALLARLKGMTIVPAGEVERLREALAMTGTEAVNLRVRVIEERAVAAERERIKREVKTVRLMQADYVIRAMNGTTRTPQTPADWVEAYRAAVLRIIDWEAEEVREPTAKAGRRLFDLHDEDDFRWLADYFSGYHGVPGLRAATFPDEERLARAIEGHEHRIDPYDKWETYPCDESCAPIIAKAYRGDTE